MGTESTALPGVPKRVVLFLCSHNSARSQMAEGFLRKYAGDRFEVQSAGLVPKGLIHPLTVRVMDESGVDLKGQSSKSLRPFLGRVKLDLVIFVCPAAEEGCPRLFPGCLRHLSWPFEDPAAFEGTEEEQLAKFRQVRDQIDEKIRGWLEGGPPLP